MSTCDGQPGGFIDVCDPRDGWLLLRFDPKRDIIVVQRRGLRTIVDLQLLRTESETKKSEQNSASA
jgi:hypothetical protein